MIEIIKELVFSNFYVYLYEKKNNFNMQLILKKKRKTCYALFRVLLI